MSLRNAFITDNLVMHLLVNFVFAIEYRENTLVFEYGYQRIAVYVRDALTVFQLTLDVYQLVKI